MFSTIGYYICIPFAWLLRMFYSLTGSYGWALILFTLAVKLIMTPFQINSKKSMVRMSRFQPKMQEIQTKYANNQARMNEELQLLYAREGLSPMSGCLWSLLPFPILIALYSIIRQPLSRFMFLSEGTITAVRTLAETLGYSGADLTGRAAFYEEISLVQFVTEHFDTFDGKFNGLFPVSYRFLGLDLTRLPQDVYRDFFTGGWPVVGLVLIPIVSAALSFAQSKIAMATNPASSQQNSAAANQTRSMLIMMPLMSLWIGFTLPAALGIYWIANSVFGIIQDYALNRYFSKRMDEEESEKEKQKREERVARLMAAREQQRQAMEGGRPRKAERRSEKKAEKKTNSTTEAGRVGDRPYARGRSFSPDHYGE